MELGELELAVLRTVRTLGEASAGEAYDALRKSRDVAYTSVTTTLYRLVEKDLVSVRRVSEKKAFYRIKEGRAYRRAMATMVDSVLDTFGGAAVSYILEKPDRLSREDSEELRGQVSRHRTRESLHE